MQIIYTFEFSALASGFDLYTDAQQTQHAQCLLVGVAKISKVVVARGVVDKKVGLDGLGRRRWNEHGWSNVFRHTHVLYSDNQHEASD